MLSRVLRWFTNALFVTKWACLIVLAGFIAFLSGIDFVKRTPSGRADAIVVLSGDPQRIREGVDLLAKGFGPRLFATGVDNGDEIARLRSLHKSLFDCCVDVDPRAEDTVGDALAVARWMGQNGLTSIIVVTSNFHLPRALLELGCVLPDVRSIPHPVVAGMVDLEDWRSSTAFKVLAAEYAKFLAVWMRTRLIGCASFRSTAGELMLGHALGPGR